jgi:hypothetical protein
MLQAQSGPATLIIVVPSCPSCPPGLRPVFFRNALALDGVLPSPSLDGGLEEFCEVCFSRASSSAIRSRSRASSARASASSLRREGTSATSTSYEGGLDQRAQPDTTGEDPLTPVPAYLGASTSQQNGTRIRRVTLNPI